jgi:electron transport complex protein RnfC
LFGKPSFTGGVHPHECKDITEEHAIQDFPAPEVVTVALLQHIGAPAQPVVTRGDQVKKGQVIAEAGGFVSAAVHAPVSGKVRSLGPTPHPFGSRVEAIEIENDGKEECAESNTLNTSWQDAAPQEIIDIIANAGIVGMGGAAFPTHVKLSPPNDKPIDTVIINGAECEPYITADYRVMLEHTDEVLTGALIVKKCVGAKKGVVAIEENKPNAIARIKERCEQRSEFGDLDVVSLKTKYPQGGEKQLIKAVTKRDVPSGGLPMDAGCVVHNVGTVQAVYAAVVHGRGLYERVVTVTGDAVEKPANLRVRIGTSFADLLAHCNADMQAANKVLMGGPMMGLAQSELSVPVIKSTSAIVVLSDLTEAVKQYDCIRCGNCVKVCPIRLVPSAIAKAVEHDDIEGASAHHIMDCIECGSCAFACPAKINLVHFMKLGKNRIRMQKKT